MIALTDNISIIKGSDNPLSSDIAIIKDDDYTFLFDVGNNEEYLNLFPNKYDVIISHFHKDHIGNFNLCNFENAYVSKETYKHTKKGTIVETKLSINNILIFNMPSNHSKGSLCLKYKEYLLVGDCLYGKGENDRVIYNIQFLKSQIDILKKLDVTYVLRGHSMDKLEDINDVIKQLEDIYSKRTKNDNFITIKY